MARRRLLALGALTGLLSCKEPTQITVVLSTNLQCPAEEMGDARVVSIGIAAQASFPAKSEITFTATTDTCDAPPDVGTLVLVPSDTREGDRVEVVIVAGAESDDGKASQTAETCETLRANGGIDGQNCVVVRRRLGFVDGLPLVLPLEIDGACLGVECGEDLTCFKGGCVDPEVECASTQTCADPPTPPAGGGGSGAGGSGASGAGGSGATGAGASGAGGSGAGGSGASGAGGTLAGGGGAGGVGGALNGGAGGALNGGGGALNGGVGSGAGGAGVGSGAGGAGVGSGAGGAGVGSGAGGAGVGSGAGGAGVGSGAGGVGPATSSGSGVGGFGAGGFGGAGGSGGAGGDGAGGGGTATEVMCDDGLDDDLDNATDCADSDCSNTLWCNDLVVVNELSAISDAEEFVELFNPVSQPVDLSGAWLAFIDASGTPYVMMDLSVASDIAANGYFVAADATVTAPLGPSSLIFPAAGGPDHVREAGPTGVALYRDATRGAPEVIDAVVFGSAMPIAFFDFSDGNTYPAASYSISDAELPGADSLARLPNGSTGSGDADWSRTTTVTIGMPNIASVGGGKSINTVMPLVATRTGSLVITGSGFGDVTSVMVGGVPQAFTVNGAFTEITVASLDESTPIGSTVVTVGGDSGGAAKPITVVNLLVSEVDTITTNATFDFAEVSTSFLSPVNLDGYTLVFFDAVTGQSMFVQALAGPPTNASGMLVVGGGNVMPMPQFILPVVNMPSSGAVAIYQGPFGTGVAPTDVALIDAFVYAPMGDPNAPALVQALMLTMVFQSEAAGPNSLQRCNFLSRRDGTYFSNALPSPGDFASVAVNCPI